MAEIQGKRGAGASRARAARVMDDPTKGERAAARARTAGAAGTEPRAAERDGAAKGSAKRDGSAPKDPRSRGRATGVRRKAAGPDRTPFLRRMGLLSALGALWVLGGCGGGVSGEIGRACMTSGRDAASRALCSCVQGVANQTLSASDQRRAARFFDDPDRAQETRISDRASDEAFWLRYRAFADTAEAICSS